MTETDIVNFSATDSSNTDIEGISVAPGWSPSNVGPAVRAIMGRLARVSQGLAPFNQLQIANASGTVRPIGFQTSGRARWQIGADASTESGGNAGSAFTLTSYDDSGAALATPLTVNRATGVVSTAVGPTINGFDPGGAHLRLVAGNYGAMLRNDGADMYFLQTQAGVQQGSFNPYRPFSWHLSSGAVSIDATGCGTSFGGAVTLANNTPLRANDTGGTPRNLLFMDNSNHVDLVNGAGTSIRFLNQAQTTAVLTCDDAGNVNVAGALSATGNLTTYGTSTLVGAVTCNAIKCTSINTQGYAVTTSGGNVTAGSGTVSGAAGTFTGAVSANSVSATSTAGGAITGSSVDVTGTINGSQILCSTLTTVNGHSLGFGWGGGLTFSIDGGGIGSLNYTPTSDYRLKEAVADAPSGALDKVLRLRPVTYRWTETSPFADGGRTHLGLIAHEVGAEVESAVQGAKDAVTETGGIAAQSVHLLPLVALLTQAVQELTARLEALEHAI